jgi:hypothetical protein
MTMTIEKVKSMSDSELLDLFKEKVECDHYDPNKTPDKMKELFEQRISQDDIAEIILERMKKV